MSAVQSIEKPHRSTLERATVGVDGSAFPHQDAIYGRDAQAAAGTLTKVGGGVAGFDFTKIDNNGNPLAEGAKLGAGTTDWACTRDNVTGLIWEVKTTSGLRNMDFRYSSYDSNPVTNGGAVGYASSGLCAVREECDTEKFTAAVNLVGLCGARDWRMPTVKELEGIADLGLNQVRVSYDPSIGPDYFPNTRRGSYWSGSPSAVAFESAWAVDFSYGSAFVYGRSSSVSVRLVRDAK